MCSEKRISTSRHRHWHRRRNRLCGHRCGPAPQPEGFGRTRSHRRHDPYACDQLTIPIRQTPLRYECIVGVPITYWLEPPQCMNPNAVCVIAQFCATKSISAKTNALSYAFATVRTYFSASAFSSSIAFWKSSRFSKFWYTLANRIYATSSRSRNGFKMALPTSSDLT